MKRSNYEAITNILADFNFDKAFKVAELLELHYTEKAQMIKTAKHVLNELLNSKKDYDYCILGYFRAVYIDESIVGLEFIPMDSTASTECDLNIN